MLRTVEAVIDEQGAVQLLEAVRLPSARRALVTILEQEPVTHPAALEGAGEPALLSEAALAADWLREEEEEAWAHLQPDTGRVERPRRQADLQGAARNQAQ